jgi:hypothetical protein
MRLPRCAAEDQIGAPRRSAAAPQPCPLPFPFIIED